ncbi:metallophosphoesterase family protein [Neobacillus terrae]|uniref:metallophosphoesterase family protein n=1 Tax=Neobacillus terrae TaxID=3034837 RepID=UPI00140B6627|nr:metallophosphoesterase [Neobacillus terrae]NHM29370.1 metallophosphoesterase [Neobacillus terrae]
MKIVVVSDTHIPRRAKKLPTALLKDLVVADLMLHAGDWQTVEVYEELSKYGKVEGVYGNVDGVDIKGIFSEKKIIEAGKFHIGIIHGHGKGQTTEKRALRAFKDDHVDLIIFGHSHIPLKKRAGEILLFNPGSATDKRRQEQYSYGVITVGETLHVEHVFYDSKE